MLRKHLCIPLGLERIHRYFCYVCGTLLPHTLEVNDLLVCRKCKTSTCMDWFNNMNATFSAEAKCSKISEINDEYASTSLFFPTMIKGAKKILKSEISLKQTLESQLGNNTRQSKFNGPSIRKECAYCGNDRMVYVTLQTRSADEGQTVIYTCTQCAKKEIENT
ncbi:hypothetical protein MN116_008841 [Schistosoma mekongi]|uniref:DNA-directed RNA polymerase subunit n=1 Tax=Schistosoma mekongi TaxID=38744 RepID=A0AAE1Z689_SCHME|nr:hypothetical protein MN116_008841 [Schistosoma mekongi]